MTVKGKFTLAFLMSASFTAIANQSTGPVSLVSVANWIGTPNNPKEELHIQTDQAQPTNPANCSKYNRYVLLDASDISKTMVLTAYTSKQKIAFNIWVGRCTADNYPQITKVTLTE